MSYQPRKVPTHEVAYQELRQMILFGELAPGQSVTIQGLVQDLDVGMTPVREAIRRLTAEGALEIQGNRRICLPILTEIQLNEIAFARNFIEPKLAFLASKNAKNGDIRELEAIDGSLNAAIAKGNASAYLEHNCKFHEFLYNLSGARVLMSISSGLWLRVGPSLRVVCGLYGTQNLPDMHEEALLALRSRDHEAVAKAIAEDIEQGHAQILISLRDRVRDQAD